PFLSCCGPRQRCGHHHQVQYHRRPPQREFYVAGSPPTMCDVSCAQGGEGGTRRCYRHRQSTGSERRTTHIRRLDAEADVTAAVAGEEGRSVHQALCGGIVAGVLFGGVLGGVVVGAAAVGASIVSRRGRDRGDDEVRVVSCSPAAAAAAPAAGRGGVASYGDMVMTREQ
ncbi:unnamed protein product, partial [Ectocarpus sp. 6 AP-2014]